MSRDLMGHPTYDPGGVDFIDYGPDEPDAPEPICTVCRQSTSGCECSLPPEEDYDR